jgi:hypothetical protein
MTDKRPPPKVPDKPTGQPEDDDKRPRHDPQGREHQVHQEILERRWRGGPAPTPEDAQRALEQWKSLPGSVVRPPTDIKRPADDSPEPPSGQPEDDKGDRP